MPFPNLFKPGKIGTMKIKNRVVMPPMVRNYADGNGLVTKRYLEHIERIANGGVGMMVLEASYIEKRGRGFVNQLGIDSNRDIPGLRKLAVAAHRHGAKIGIQLYHAGRQTTHHASGTQPVAPSPIPDPLEQEMPRQLKVEEIKMIAKKFGDAARRAKAAGLDFVEIHGAHGYLITQFLSPFTNKRTDAYGGTFEKRLRFCREVIAAVRAAVGPKYPVVIRLTADEMVPGGLTLPMSQKIAKAIERGVDAIHVSVGNYASYAKGFLIAPMAADDALLVKYAKGIKKAVKVPVIAVGKLRTPAIAEAVLRSGAADFIAIGRPLLADPNWPDKARHGRADLIMKCTSCNQGCIDRLFKDLDVWCTVNPETSREEIFAKHPGKSKKVLVVGGGPAGLFAAKVAAERGHKVTLYDENKKLGGQVLAAANLPYRSDWNDFLKTLIAQVERERVKVITGKKFVPDLIKKGDYDAAIVAVGSSPLLPILPGVNHPNVILARRYNEGTEHAKGKNIVVAGGGCQGAQTAEALASGGRSVKLVEMTGGIAADMPFEERSMLMARLAKKGVELLTETKILSIGPSAVVVRHGKNERTLPASTVVVCVGSFPNDGITAQLKKLVKKTVVVGDAVKPRRITEAVAEGALAAVNL